MEDIVLYIIHILWCMQFLKVGVKLRTIIGRNRRIRTNR